MSRTKSGQASPKKVAKKPVEVVETSTETAEKVDLMYVGPSIVGAIRYSTVFKDGILPEEVEKCITAYPAMRRLFVPLDGLADATLQLKKPSALSVIYKQTAQKFTRRN